MSVCVFVQIDGRLASLSEQYDGPQPSDVCNLLEGEQFFAGFERGIDITSGVPTHTHALFLYIFEKGITYSK